MRNARYVQCMAMVVLSHMLVPTPYHTIVSVEQMGCGEEGLQKTTSPFYASHTFSKIYVLEVTMGLSVVSCCDHSLHNYWYS